MTALFPIVFTLNTPTFPYFLFGLFLLFLGALLVIGFPLFLFFSDVAKVLECLFLSILFFFFFLVGWLVALCFTLSLMEHTRVLFTGL